MRSVGWVAVGLVVVLAAPAAADTFWYVPLPNYGPYADRSMVTTLAATNDAPAAATWTVTSGTMGAMYAGAVAPYDTDRYDLQFFNPDAGVYQDEAYRIEADDKVAVTYFNPIRMVYTNDAGRLLGQQHFGTEHYAFSWDNPSWPYTALQPFVVVVAPEDGTTVKFTAPVDTDSGPGLPAATAGTTNTVLLNDFDVLVITSQDDLTGTHVLSDKPVAVFSGHECTDIGAHYCDHISEEMLPIDLAGDEFVFCSTSIDRGYDYDVVRILNAGSGPATVTLDPIPMGVTSPFTLANPGDYFSYDARQDTVIRSTQPVLVAAYMGKDDASHTVGDPALIQLTPMDRFSSERAFYVPPSFDLSLTVSSPSGASLIFDGAALPTGRMVGGTGYSCTYKPLTSGTHVIKSSTGVGATVWATQSYASFWYDAGGEILPRLRWSFDNTFQDCKDDAVRFFADEIELPPGRTLRAAAWDFGDGTRALGERTQHIFRTAGTYQVTLEIEDSLGSRSRISQSVPTAGDINCPPEFVRDDYDRSIYAQRTLRACVDATDYEADERTYEILPPVPYDLHFANARCLEWTPSIDQVGDWGPFTLKVTDAFGGVDTSRLHIHVLPLPEDPPDRDQDGIADLQDNCPEVRNTDQADDDMDGIGDACELVGQEDPSGPGGRDPVALPDRDGDGVPDAQDLCVAAPDPAQSDTDHDGLGDACDLDGDGDGVVEASGDARTLLDNCPLVGNPDQADADGDGQGDVCDPTPASVRAAPPLEDAPEAQRSAAGAGLAALAGLLGVAAARRRGTRKAP